MTSLLNLILHKHVFYCIWLVTYGSKAQSEVLNTYFCPIFFFSGFLGFPCRPADLQKHSQPNRPGHHSGSRQLWPRPGWSGSVQRAGPGDVWPAQTQVLGGGAETTAHDQESPQDLHSWRPEGNLLLVRKLSQSLSLSAEGERGSERGADINWPQCFVGCQGAGGFSIYLFIFKDEYLGLTKPTLNHLCRL